jgi:hypothetical protein
LGLSAAFAHLAESIANDSDKAAAAAPEDIRSE